MRELRGDARRLTGPVPPRVRPSLAVVRASVLALLAAVGLAGCVGPPGAGSGRDPVPSAPLGSSSGAPRTALALLATLPVKGRAPLTGYDREARFGEAWLDVDGNGCSTREDVLRRDLDGVRRDGCRVLTGTLTDPYTRVVVAFRRGPETSDDVQIDHVVALANAWRTGAQQLSPGERVRLANDPLNLFAVDGPTNQDKGASDAATWLPPNRAFRCTYVAHQVAVKAAYRLWVTPAERDAIARVLGSCPAQRAPESRLRD